MAGMLQLVLGRDVGKPFKDFASVLSQVERRIFDQVELEADQLGPHLAAHPRLTYVIAHGGAISWMPITVALIQRLAQHAPDRLGTGTFHKGLWNLPGVGRIAKFFSGAERHLSFDELFSALGGGDCDFFAFPESDSSLYGELTEVKPFRFHRFIELSVRARMPMLLVAHKGTERWYRAIPSLAPVLSLLPAALYSMVHLKKDQVIAETTQKLLNVPIPFGRISLRARTELFHTRIKSFSDDAATKKAQLEDEGERIRLRLQRLTDSIT